jgi:hypothetical protein
MIVGANEPFNDRLNLAQCANKLYIVVRGAEDIYHVRIDLEEAERLIQFPGEFDMEAEQNLPADNYDVLISRAR